jgi:hypothetical protein
MELVISIKVACVCVCVYVYALCNNLSGNGGNGPTHSYIMVLNYSVFSKTIRLIYSRRQSPVHSIWAMPVPLPFPVSPSSNRRLSVTTEKLA